MFDVIISIIYYIFPFLITLTVLVFVHELGHYLVAIWNSVKVEIFSVGFGPELYGWTDRRGTRWRISIIPLGGYVKFYGDMGVTSSKKRDDASIFNKDEEMYSFHNKKIHQRMAVVIAGPFANFLLAVILFTFIYVFFGQTYTPPIINNILNDSAAEEADLRIGDRIIEVEGNSIKRFEDIRRIVQLRPNENLDFLIKRGDKNLILTVKPKLKEITDRFGNKHRLGQLGIQSSTVEYVKYNIYESFILSINSTYHVISATLIAVKQMIFGRRNTDELSGIIGIAKMTGDIAQIGILPVIQLAAFLSISLGLINLFPIPLLDGGHLLFYIFEAILGKPISSKIQEFSMKFGFIVIISLFLLTTINDINRINLLSKFYDIFS